MVCESNKVDSNITGLAFAEEECLKKLPGANGADAIWQDLEPNSYSDFGGELTTIARSPIDPSRQNKKGVVTDLDASGGFNIDFTKTNLNKLLQGFFFADARQMPTTKPLNGAAVAVSGVTAADKTFTVASGGTDFKVGMLVKPSGFANVANNELSAVVSSTATEIVVTGALVDEAAPDVSAKLDCVGFQGAEGDINIAVTGQIPSLISTTADFTSFGLIPGQWVFIGEDNAGNSFENNKGYARINGISQNAIVFDDTTFNAITESGAGKAIRVYVGMVIKNEKLPSLIKRRTYNIERTLGAGPTSTQAEYLEGAVCNELTLNIPLADKINTDLSFIACDNTYRSGESGDEVKPGIRNYALGEDAYNTSSDIYRMKMSVHDSTVANKKALFGYVSEASISISNNATPNKAVGVLGAFDVSIGNFQVGGSVTAFFTTVEAVKAIRANADVGFSIIGGSKNAGFVFDIPLLGLGGGRISVEKDNPIEVPLTPAGAENKHGYTLLFEHFSYLPNAAMSQ